MPKSQPKHQINVDLAKVFELDNDGKKHFLTVLGWGDEVEVLNAEDVENGKATRIEVKATKFIEQPNTAPKPQNVTRFIMPPKGIKAKDVIVRIEDSDVLNSGQTKLKEAYAFEIKDGKPQPTRVRQI
jgi:hypothetical protein